MNIFRRLLFGEEPMAFQPEAEGFFEAMAESVEGPKVEAEPGHKPTTSGIHFLAHLRHRPWDPAMTNSLYDDETEAEEDSRAPWRQRAEPKEFVGELLRDWLPER